MEGIREAFAQAVGKPAWPVLGCVERNRMFDRQDGCSLACERPQTPSHSESEADSLHSGMYKVELCVAEYLGMLFLSFLSFL